MKEEAEKKKAEEAAKKAEEKKKKDEEKRLEAEKKAEEERLAEEAKKKAKLLPDINCACFDVLLHPIEEKMDNILGKTIDPLGEEQTGHTRPNEHMNILQLSLHVSLSLSPDYRYIAWLSLVALAYNYNVWFATARMAFPYHNDAVNHYWVICDILSDVVNVIDIVLWQPRLQFVKAGDIIVSRQALMTVVFLNPSVRVGHKNCLSLAERQSSDQGTLSEITTIQGENVISCLLVQSN